MARNYKSGTGAPPPGIEDGPGSFSPEEMPWLPQPGKCKRCRGPAPIGLPSHHLLLCLDCFGVFFQNGVRRALEKAALPEGDRLAVAVSGGKDSLVVWDVLHRMGYDTLGVHLDLGIGEFSAASTEAVRAFAEPRGLEYREYSLADLFGHTVSDAYGWMRQEVCSVCGALKRHFLNRLAVDLGCPHLVTGHNLDDEAARLLGNVIRRRTRFLEKFYPHLPSAHPRQASRIKPLYRMDEMEIRTYAAIHGIRPAEGGCPYAKGATTTDFKHCLNWLESRMPGTKRDFVFGTIRGKTPPAEEHYNNCTRCGQPTYSDVCVACKIKERLGFRRERIEERRAERERRKRDREAGE